MKLLKIIWMMLIEVLWLFFPPEQCRIDAMGRLIDRRYDQWLEEKFGIRRNKK